MAIWFQCWTEPAASTTDRGRRLKSVGTREARFGSALKRGPNVSPIPPENPSARTTLVGARNSITTSAAISFPVCIIIMVLLLLSPVHALPGQTDRLSVITNAESSIDAAYRPH